MSGIHGVYGHSQGIGGVVGLYFLTNPQELHGHLRNLFLRCSAVARNTLLDLKRIELDERNARLLRREQDDTARLTDRNGRRYIAVEKELFTPIISGVYFLYSS